MKSKRNGFLAQIGLTALGLGLLFYAASRTLHFVQTTMPPDQQYLGYLFLLATGIGAIIWLYTFLTLAEGAKQRGLSFAMGLIDLIGEGVLVYADTVRQAGANGIIQFNADETRTFVIASVGMIFLNAFAWYMFKLWDPKAEQQSAARDLVDDVRDSAFKQLNTPESKQTMINELAPMLKLAILDEVTMQVREMAAQHIKAIDAPAIDVTPKPKGKQPPAPLDLAGAAQYAQDVPQVKPERNKDFEAYQHRPGEVYGPYTEPSYHPVSMDPKPKEQPNPYALKYCPRCKKETRRDYMGNCAGCHIPYTYQEDGSQPPAPFPSE